eukprot:9503891-Pyramimonas_sp.AAC.2
MSLKAAQSSSRWRRAGWATRPGGGASLPRLSSRPGLPRSAARALLLVEARGRAVGGSGADRGRRPVARLPRQSREVVAWESPGALRLRQMGRERGRVCMQASARGATPHRIRIYQEKYFEELKTAPLDRGRRTQRQIHCHRPSSR